MSRKIFVLLMLLMIGGFVVAYVHAQESSRRRSTIGSVPKSQRQTTTPSSGLRSSSGGTVIHFGDQKPQSTVQSTAPSKPSAAAVPSTRGGSLADRLKAIRRNAAFPQATSNSNNSAANDQKNFLPSQPTVGSAVPSTPTVVSNPAPSAAALPSVNQQAPIVTPSNSFENTSESNNSVVDPGSELRSVLQKKDTASQSEIAIQDSINNEAPIVREDTTSRRSISTPDVEYTARSPLRTNQQESESSNENIGISRTPDIQISTAGPKAVVINKESTYTVTVSNLGDTTANDVQLTINVPQWVKLVSNQTSRGTARSQIDNEGQIVWNLDVVAARTREQITIHLIPRANRAFEVSVDWSFQPESTNTRIEVQQPELELTITGAEEILYGETTSYTITISNPGTGAAENVVLHLAPLSPQQQASQTSEIGTIPAGGKKQFKVDFNARQAGKSEIRANVEGDGGLLAEAVVPVVVRRANFQVEAGGPKLKFAGSIVSYQIDITNNGDASAEKVIVTAALPGGAEFVSGTEGSQLVDGGVRWSVGNLPPGSQRSFEIKCKLNSAGDNRLVIQVQGAGDLTARDLVETRVEAIAIIRLTVTEPDGPKPVGEEVIYEIHLINKGTESARRVNVIAQFSDGIEPVAADGGRAEIVPGQVLFDSIDRIRPGEELVLRVAARADKAGNHVFRAEVKCADPETRLASEGTTRFFSENLISKTSTATAPRTLDSNPAPAKKIDIRR